ncbi:hypothetical protein, partial [Pseudomonas syringae group genomosp. 7]|uniref:hypothetical protein n=1 Tax=Pseudomonas syringae group genomosp. 7 TaxID=251699 RepID=UPI00376FC9B6
LLDRPLPHLSEALGEARVDAFAVSVQYAPESEAIQVPNVLVVNKTNADSKPTLWMLSKGLILIETLQELNENVAARL